MIIVPPSLAYFRLGRFRVWLPVIIVWPVLAALELLLAPIALAAGAIIMPWNRKKGKLVMAAIPKAMEIFALTRGMELDVAAADKTRIVLRLL
ncbi:MAG: hypothetical protein JW909_12235 [Planctomycetes bacterium]|nr:hypothetical protein [Planctomycetota bacterium]